MSVSEAKRRKKGPRVVTILLALSAIQRENLASAQDAVTRVPTVAEVLQEIRTSRARYRSLDVVENISGYRGGEPGSPTAELYRKARHSWRWKEGREWSREEAHQPPGGSVRSEVTTTYSLTDESSKQLTERKLSEPRGVIDHPGAMSVGSVLHALFEAVPRFELYADHCTIRRDSKTNNLVIELKPVPNTGDRISMALTVNPDIGYLPVESVSSSDGGIIQSCRCSDFREVVDGLFLPHKWRQRFGGGDEVYHIITQIEKVRVNVPLNDELFDLSFPSGTRVDDRIANERYTVRTGAWLFLGMTTAVIAAILLCFFYFLRRVVRRLEARMHH